MRVNNEVTSDRDTQKKKTYRGSNNAVNASKKDNLDANNS